MIVCPWTIYGPQAADGGNQDAELESDIGTIFANVNRSGDKTCKNGMSQNKVIEMNKNRRIKIPEVKTMFGIKRNPLQDDLRIKELTDHLFEFSEMSPKSYEKVKCCTEFSAYYHPFCPDIKRYQTLVMIMLLSLIVDDHTECPWGDVARRNSNSKIIWGQFYESIDRALNCVLKKNEFISMANWKPYIVSQFIAFEEIYQDLKDNQMLRLLEEYRKYAKGNIDETNVIETGHQIMSYEEYFSIRISSVGLRVVFALVEYADNLYITDEEWEDPLMQKYFDLGAILISISNDIFSFEKELNERYNKPELTFNLVAHKMNWDNLTVEETILSIVQMYANYEKDTKVIKQQLKEKYKSRKDIQQLLENIDYIVGGNIEVHYHIHRYNEPRKYNYNN